jgi:preprotein translocase subunit SecE
MAKSKATAGFWGELAKFNLYKRNQGRLTRQLTWVGIAAVVFIGCWQLSQGPLSDYGQEIRVGIPLLLAALGGWAAFRLVNFPRFADFLISVEAEMDKVSWASWGELKRATIVVLVTMFFLGFVLFAYDWVWTWLFSKLGILDIQL